MTKLQRAAHAAHETVHSIALGFAQMVTFGGVEPVSTVDEHTVAEAIRSDWEKVGSDMRRTFEHVQGDGARR